MTEKDGGPAFPGLIYTGRLIYGQMQLDKDMIATPLPDGSHAGMSLRDYFAAAALIIYSETELMDAAHSSAKENKRTTATEIAMACYELADAMLAERDKEFS